MFGAAAEKCELFWFYYLSVLSCSVLDSSVVGLDIQDEMGRHEVGHIDNSMKIPLNQGDGCRFEGEFTINKVSRNTHTHTHISYCLMWPSNYIASGLIRGHLVYLWTSSRHRGQASHFRFLSESKAVDPRSTDVSVGHS